MSYKKLILEESEKLEILSKYRDNEFIISDWISPDSKYIIFLDDLIDIENKELIGNIWENFDNFKFFLKYSFEISSNIPAVIKEQTLKQINGLVLTESIRDYTFLKPYVKQMIIEFDLMRSLKSGISDFTNWGEEQINSAISGITNFAETVGSGAKDFVKSISKSDWTEALNIIGKGMLYTARKIRDAMYHPVGLVLDAIFIALAPETLGVTEIIKWLPWLVIVVLDILEITNIVDSEEELPMWLRFVYLGIDVLGLVTTGYFSKSAKSLFSGMRLESKTSAEAAKIISNNSEASNFIVKMLNGFKNLPIWFEKGSKYLSKTKLGTYFSKSINVLSDIINKATKELEHLIGYRPSKALKAGLGTTGIVYGGEKVMKKMFDTDNEISKEEITNLTSGSADYGEF